ncbi:deacetylase Atu3266-like [Sycon ciliatum]|uniref:deacetylase Atu3266-like n=1 Tax=Sycon ciliatum TaxID=27933 RepID=UPI0031F64548
MASAGRIVLRGGRVIDRSLNIDHVCDVIIVGDVIEALVDCGGQYDGNDDVRDVSGCLVVPGLIDLHIHGYEHATPLGIDVDKYCLHRGVTTAVDAGSAGATTFPGLRKFIAEKSRTRLLAYLNISMHGLASAGCSGYGLGGELDSAKQINADSAAKCIEENRDMIVGIKIRLSADGANDGKNEQLAMRTALECAKRVQLPVMAHHSMSTVKLGGEEEVLSCPGSLRPGDVYTHFYHAYESTVVDVSEPHPVGGYSKFDPAVLEARKHGVLMDIGHGQGSFSWTIAELGAKEGQWPDVISTDLHTGSMDGPAYDLPTVMTKMLHVGMPLLDIITAVTATPAECCGRADKHQLRPGAEADVTVLRLDDCSTHLEDSQAQLRHVTKRILPVAVWRAGEEADIILPEVWPNTARMPTLSKEWKKLLVKDAKAPEAMAALQ